MSNAQGELLGPARDDTSIVETEIHDVLRNDRRRMILEVLGASSDPVTVRELSEVLAARESGNDPPPRDVRRSVYISLQQTHLPKLSDLGIVNYDDTTKEVRPGEHASAVGVYMEVVPKYGLSFAEFHAALGVFGALLVAAAEVGVPVFASVPGVTWALAAFGLLVASAAYQTYKQRSSLVHRLRD